MKLFTHERTIFFARRLRDLLTNEQYWISVDNFKNICFILKVRSTYVLHSDLDTIYIFLVSRLCHDIVSVFEVRHAPHCSTLNEDTNTTSVLISQFAN